MPNPSIWPAVTAVGVLGVIGSILFTHKLPHSFFFITLSGAAILFYGVYRWAFEQPFPEEH